MGGPPTPYPSRTGTAVSTGKKQMQYAALEKCSAFRNAVRYSNPVPRYVDEYIHGIEHRDEEKRKHGKSKRSAEVHERAVQDHNQCNTIVIC